jgi:hypothetical protein
MLTMAIAWPPSTYTSFLSLFAFSILEKLYSLLLHVESNKFLVLLKFLSCCYSCCCCRKDALLLLLLVLLEGALRFLQPTKAGTNEVGTIESRCQNFSLSPILFLSSSCRVKKKKNRNCSAIGHHSNAPRPSALPDIVVTCCEVQRAAGHRSNVARSSALLAIAATLRRPAPQECCKL